MRFLVRSAIVRGLFVVLLAIVATLAHTAPAHAAPVSGEPELRVASALFTTTRTDDGLTWRASWVLTPESAAELEDGATRTLRFALPLADNVRLDTAVGLEPVVADGVVVGVLVERAALAGRTIRAVVHQREALHADSHVRLGAPVAAGLALQIIDGDLGSDTRLEIDTGRGLERRVGHVAPTNVGHGAREEARRLTGYDSRLTGAALYIRGDDLEAARGVTATIVTPRGRARHGALAIAIAFAAIVVVLILAVRRLRDSAGVERADALLAAEVDALDGKAH
jgi:hypothetical protein